MPSWFGEIAVFAHCLTHEGILKAIQKLGAQNRIEAARLAEQKGWL
jgi:hypothetical protein